MQNPYDVNSNADNALLGGTSASTALGFPSPRPQAGIRPSSDAILAEAQARLDQLRTPAPKPPAEPMVGYNPQNKTIFSGGRVYEAGNLGALAQAHAKGDLDITDQQLPAGYAPMPSATVRQKLSSVPDWKKEMGSSLRNYGANMALLGGTITGSQGMKDTYSRLNSEAEALAGQSAAPKSWDEAEFGTNMLPYVRQLGIQSVPYIAEALVTGFGLGSAFKGMGTAAAKSMASNAIAKEAASIVAKNTVAGVARISQEQAILQAAQNVGTMFARSAGTVVGTYPSAVGDILGNQMEQSGKVDGTSAALLAVPYAGLNLLGGTGLVAGTGRAIERGLGVNTLGRAARGGAAAGLTVGGEAFNEAGQEVLNQAGRVAVDPNASMASPDALARYKESAIGGAILGGFAGAGAGAAGYMRPAERAVTPQMLNENEQAQLARYETDYAREGMVRDQAAGAGGENFVGPAMGGKPQAAPVSVEQELADQATDDVISATSIGRGKGKREVVVAAMGAGIDLESEAADKLVKLIKKGRLAAAAKELEKLKNDSTAGSTGAGDGTLGQAGGVEPAGSVGAGVPVADSGAGGTSPSAGELGGGVQPPVAGGTGLPTNAVRMPVPDFSLEHTPGAPSASYLAQNPQPVEEAPQQTDNLSLKTQKDTGQQALFDPEVKRKRKIDVPKLAPRAAVNQGSALLPTTAEALPVKETPTNAKMSRKRQEVFDAVEAAKPAEQRAAEAKQEADEKTTVPPVEEFTKAFGAIAGRRAHAAARGETWEAIAKREGVTAKAVRDMVNRQKGDKASSEVKAALAIAQDSAVARRNKAAIAEEGGDSSAFDTTKEPEHVQELMVQGGMQVQSAGNTGVKATEAEGGFSKTEQALQQKLTSLTESLKYHTSGEPGRGDPTTIAKIRRDIERTTDMWAEAQTTYLDKEGQRKSKFVKSKDYSEDTDKSDAAATDETEELGSDEMLWSDDIDHFDSMATQSDVDVPLGRTDFKNGKEAAEYVAETDTRTWVQWLANLIAPHLAGTKVHFVKAGDTLASTGLPDGDKATVFSRFSYGDLALHLTASDGSHHVFLRLDGKLDHEALMHELLHAATVDAIRAGDKTFDAIAQQVRYALGSMPQWLAVSNDDVATLKDLAGRFRDTKEFVAYAFTNPAFQKVLKHLATDGRWVTDYRSPEAQARVVEPTPTKVRVRRAKPLTMWQKFVDAVRNLFGAGRPHADAFEAAMAVERADELRNKQAETVTYKSLRADLEDSLKKLVAANAAMAPTVGEASTNSITAKLPVPLQEAPKNIGETLRAFGQTALNVASFTEDLIARAVTKGIKSAKAYDIAQKLRASKAGERERAAIKVMEPFNDLSGAQQRAANAFLYESTRTAKWGYAQPGSKAAVDPAMAQKFKELTPGAQAFVKSVFAHGQKMLADKKAMVTKVVDDEFAEDLAEAKKNKDAKGVARVEENKRSMLTRFQTLFALREGSPYAPLRRDGDWLVIGTSKEYAAASPEDQRGMQTDPDHYHVSFVDSEGEARDAAKVLTAEGMTTVYRPKEAMMEEMFGGKGVLGALFSIKHKVEQIGSENRTEAERATMKQLQRIVTSMYLNALGEASARKSEMRRKGIAGNIDMVRGFGLQARADAQFMATVEFNRQIMDAIAGMRKESTTGENQAEKMKLYNELMQRQVETQNAKEQVASARITRATSLWMLATSPAYYITNATQPFVLSVPYMAKNHTYGAAASAMTKAWGEVAGMVKAIKWNHTLDLSDTPADARAAMENLAKLGIIDIGMSSEMGSFQVADRNRATKAWNKVDDTLRIMSQKLEAINRLSTGIAAYRLEMARTGDATKAEEYAGKVITQTHGDYGRANAPRAFNSGLGRVALQFRKFQLIQITLISKMVKEAFAGATADEKLAARRGLAFVFAHMGVLGGMAAMPGYALWSAAAAALMGDEGPDDLEQQLRKAIGNQFISDMLIRGMPAAGGVDVSGKIGMATMLSVLPFTDVDFSKRKSVTEMGYALTLGATGGLALRGADALKYMTQGDYYRGVESAMPSGIMNLLKSARFASAGVTNSKGEVLVKGEEAGAATALARALGFTPTTDARRNMVTSRQYDEDQYFRDRVNTLKRQYTEAVRSGKSVQPVVESWRSMQESQRARGIVVTPLGQLMRAPMQTFKNERDTEGGVQFRRNNRESVQSDVKQ